MTRAKPRARAAVEPHKTRPITAGMSTTAVSTLFQVMEVSISLELHTESNHRRRKKSRKKFCEAELPAGHAGGLRKLRHRAFADAAVAALALLEFEHGLDETCTRKIRPQRFRDVELRISDLPEQK